MNVTSVIERRSFDFNGVEVSFQSIDGDWWVDASSISKALGYGSARSVLTLFERNRDDFQPQDSRIIKLMSGDGKRRSVRLFTQIASQLLAFACRTPLCTKYRRWIAQVMLQLATGQAALVSRADVQRMIEEARATTERLVRAEVTAELSQRFEQFLRDIIAKKDEQIEALAGLQRLQISHAGSVLSYLSHNPTARAAIQEERERKIGQRWLPGIDANFPTLDGGDSSPARLN
jgi:prophage antirepressor-like protein